MKVLQVVGYKNAGKTTLVCEMVRMWAAEGKRVATLKRDAHQADPEPEGVDTRLHREAGAFLSGMTSARRTSWVREQPAELDSLLFEAEQSGAELVIVEGFKTAPHPKIVLLRDNRDADLLQLSRILAVASRSDPLDRSQTVDASLEWANDHDRPPSAPHVFHTNDRHFGPLLDYVRSKLVL